MKDGSLRCDLGGGDAPRESQLAMGLESDVSWQVVCSWSVAYCWSRKVAGHAVYMGLDNSCGLSVGLELAHWMKLLSCVEGLELEARWDVGAASWSGLVLELTCRGPGRLEPGARLLARCRSCMGVRAVGPRVVGLLACMVVMH